MGEILTKLQCEAILRALDSGQLLTGGTLRARLREAIDSLEALRAQLEEEGGKSSGSKTRRKLDRDPLKDMIPGPGVRLAWHLYPQEKPVEKGLYLCYALWDCAFWFNWWVGTRWRYHSGEMDFWSLMPDAPGIDTVSPSVLSRALTRVVVRSAGREQ